MLAVRVRSSGAALAADARILAPGDVLKARKIATGAHVVVTQHGRPLFAGTAWPSFALPADVVSLPALLAAPAQLADGHTIELEALQVAKHDCPVAQTLHAAITPLGADEAELLRELLQTVLLHMLVDIGVALLGSTLQLTFQGQTYRAELVAADDDAPLTQPGTLVLVTRHTRLALASSAAPEPESLVDARAYSALGGLDAQIAAIRTLVELPLTQPALFAHYGLPTPRGVLLYGPPGTGKTSLARTVAASLKAHVLTINGPELSSTFHGETESKLRAVFERAATHERAIIVIDEIDALAPRRDSSAAVQTEGAGEVERRVVATLLTLLDGMNTTTSGRVVVIAATNRPNALDPALRRPGRLDREIEIGVPDRDARLAILQVLLRPVPHTLSTDDLDAIAARTHGYVGADLAALVREAGMAAIARRVHALDAGMARLSLTPTDADPERVAPADFVHAQAIVRPSAMREVFVETPKVSWSDIADNGEQTGPDGETIPSVQRQIRECVEWPLKYAHTFQRLGIDAPKGALLYGPPGCSKTMTAKALAKESGLNFLAIRGPELVSKYVGESERAIREMFRRARAAAPAILFFDELDAISGVRSHDTSSAANDRIVASLLTEMDGIDTDNHVIVIAATNRPDCIDPALLRPGRMDRLVYVGPPNVEARRKILTLRTQKMAIAGDVDLHVIAELADGCSGAEMVSICQEAGMLAMNEDMECQEIAARHFETAARTMRRRITPQMLEEYARWRRIRT
ncbi:AAA+-type ATPase [Malassezia brasiliensis]|uniref:AAA+-type ATPase n=1 Tax=Malassezia brasiliensis TaxID=1821822 RepID=A0AAF0IPT1_9BASI|nr:AAA+-type ATPase [Malassezia brasiliensis]